MKNKFKYVVEITINENEVETYKSNISIRRLNKRLEKIMFDETGNIYEKYWKADFKYFIDNKEVEIDEFLLDESNWIR